MYKLLLLAIVGIILIFWNFPGVLLGVVILSILCTYFWFDSKENEIQRKKYLRLAREREERKKAEEERNRKEKTRTYGHDIPIEERKNKFFR